MYSQHVELRHLRYFLAVAQELHFGRAAEKLQIAQPPLSQQIRQLERTLGVQLFERNYHTVTLTNAGQVFLEEAQRVLEQMEYALSRVQDAQRGLAGRLDIGYVESTSTTTTLMSDILAIYRQRFPAVEIRLREVTIQDQLQAIQAQQIQVVFVLSPSVIPDELDSVVIERIPLVAAFAQRHPLASQASISLHSLSNEPFIFCQRQVSHFFYDRIIQLCGFSPRITQEVPDIRMQLGLVAANLGIAIVPASAADIRNLGIVYRPLVDLDGDGAIETVLVWRRKDIPPLVQEFLAVAHEVLGRRTNTATEVEEM
ncbi:LysR substrate-binding domain-containing protein [Dictyobacter arantiisoli]|uniref:LysR family transcriptional regulator n=1 Tax=Dictyobacter arantiisoli TaxID=2014874 RepID=A0A5A5TGH6_9CHLR|nr:LysR substrate-binding domain-containing protein [Dictyobacter arantiisoli]GCF10163.1 LysR family transcriptional regulator [Dictyobacter arantiisoli]